MWSSQTGESGTERRLTRDRETPRCARFACAAAAPRGGRPARPAPRSALGAPHHALASYFGARGQCLVEERFELARKSRTAVTINSTLINRKNGGAVTGYHLTTASSQHIWNTTPNNGVQQGMRMHQKGGRRSQPCHQNEHASMPESLGMSQCAPYSLPLLGTPR